MTGSFNHIRKLQKPFIKYYANCDMLATENYGLYKAKITLFSEGDFDVFIKCGVKLGYKLLP